MWKRVGIGKKEKNLTQKYNSGTWFEAGYRNDTRTRFDTGYRVHYCRRKVWAGVDTDRCIWHADIADKPADVLKAVRSEGAARLDRAVLRESLLLDGVPLSESRLREANLSGTDLRNAELSGADLRDANLGGAVIVGADLAEADLRRVNLSDTNLRDSVLRNANLQDTELDNAVLRNTDLGGADLRESDLNGANLKDADLRGADLEDADLRGADLEDADLQNVNLEDADLREANLQQAHLGLTNLEAADLGGANLLDAFLAGTDLRTANLSDADLRGADLTACTLHQTIFEEAIFDESTTFGISSAHEIESDKAAKDESLFARRVSTRFRALGRPFTDSEPLARAETQYRTIQRLRREHDLQQDPDLEIQGKHARRKRALAEHRYWEWFNLAVYRWLMGYGEKPWHVVGTSVVVILAAMLAYPHAGGFKRTGGPTTSVAALSQTLALPESVTSAVGPWLTSFYFSVVTFTTVGYGDLQPATEMGRLLASIESFTGALLMALLVFVLGRRATW